MLIELKNVTRTSGSFQKLKDDNIGKNCSCLCPGVLVSPQGPLWGLPGAAQPELDPDHHKSYNFTPMIECYKNNFYTFKSKFKMVISIIEFEIKIYIQKNRIHTFTKVLIILIRLEEFRRPEKSTEKWTKCRQLFVTSQFKGLDASHPIFGIPQENALLRLKHRPLSFAGLFQSRRSACTGTF